MQVERLVRTLVVELFTEVVELLLLGALVSISASIGTRSFSTPPSSTTTSPRTWGSDSSVG
jgi:hypothetical protein